MASVHQINRTDWDSSGTSKWYSEANWLKGGTSVPAAEEASGK